VDRLRRYGDVRAATEALVTGLAVEDLVVQSMPDASPLKWQLAHTSWFFETFVLARDAAYRPFHPRYNFLFNSYYESIGERWERPARGLLSRPTVDEVRAYRRHVDGHMRERLPSLTPELRAVAELGLAHEEQHQELMLTDGKHLLSLNPLEPSWRAQPEFAGVKSSPLDFVAVDGGIRELGFAGDGFAFDNESPRHAELVAPFALATRLVTNGEYARFIDDGGYTRPELWLFDGWATLQREHWRAPLYWRDDDGGRRNFTLAGWRSLDADAPVAHVSYYEADAYARWAGARLPTEFEWEAAATEQRDRLAQLYDCCWQWTTSGYAPYRGYRAAAGALGEYNGKFMCNQLVLRGGSCATPPGHTRATYRNFFPAATRWQFSGIRLAKDQ
jgi:ergothioneine biosynthesis protein EgtB